MKKPQTECLESPSMPLYSHNRSGAILATFLAALCAAAAVGDTLETTPFSKKIPITISGYAGSTELTDFPVLVTLAENAPIGFSYDDCAPDGADLLTVSRADGDGRTLLACGPDIGLLKPETDFLIKDMASP